MPKYDFNKITTLFQSNFIEITIWHECSPVNLLHICKTLSCNNVSEGLLLDKASEATDNQVYCK